MNVNYTASTNIIDIHVNPTLQISNRGELLRGSNLLPAVCRKSTKLLRRHSSIKSNKQFHTERPDMEMAVPFLYFATPFIDLVFLLQNVCFLKFPHHGQAPSGVFKILKNLTILASIHHWIRDVFLQLISDRPTSALHLF